MVHTRETHPIPAHIQGMLSLLMTLVAAVLYALVLGGAVARTVIDPQPYFSENMVRAAGLLSGLVGAVVTAGFARSRAPAATPIRLRYRPQGRAAAIMTWLPLRSLVRRKLLSLAETLGLPVPAATLRDHDDSQVPHPPMPGDLVPAPAPDDEADPPRGASAPMWMALLYFAVYFLVGISAFLVSIWRGNVPELVSNAGWVWLGTIISSTYAFLGLNARE